jgi:hypothetical protein
LAGNGFFSTLGVLNKMMDYSDLFDDFSDGFSFGLIFNDISKVFNDTIVSEFISKISGGNHLNKSESNKKVLFVLCLFKDIFETRNEKCVNDLFLEGLFISH